MSDRLNQGISDVICTVSLNLVVLSYMHDGLIKLALDHFVVSETFSGNS